MKDSEQEGRIILTLLPGLGSISSQGMCILRGQLVAKSRVSSEEATGHIARITQNSKTGSFRPVSVC